MEDDKKRFPPQLPRADGDRPIPPAPMYGPPHTLGVRRARPRPGLILLALAVALGAALLAWMRLTR